jgi:glycosyltransferase involved in cell wall biosynthesis
MTALGLVDCIEVVQASGPEEIARLYARATCAVVPSLYEGFGLPAVEAMACGVPVITTDGGALPEVVGEAGVVVPAGDAASLQQAMAGLLVDPQRRATLAQAGREHVEAHYTWGAVAESLTNLYRRVMAAC